MVRKRLFLSIVIFILLLQTIAGASEELNFTGKDKETKETLKIKNRVVTHSIKYSYPELTDYKDKALEDSFNKYVSSIVIKEVEDFKKDIKASETDLLESDFNGELQSYFNIEYSIINKANNLISIKFLTEVYYAGAAHPSHAIWTVNYSLKSGKALNLGDLFKKDSNYLKVISDYSINELSEKAKKDGKEQGYEPDLNWIKEGASPKEENFTSFNLTGKELIINFNEYQVDCYAAGPKEVVIPFSVLKDIISHDEPPGSK
jgi:hypothetical protein